MKPGRWFLICGIVLINIFILSSADRACAVPNPKAISWRANPPGFIASLYRGVLGRNPESRQAVAGWAAQVNNTPDSRLRVFWLFVHSQEYRKSRWARLAKEYHVYRKSQRKTRYWEYYAAKRSAGGQHLKGPHSFGVAMALVGYYRAFYPKW